MLIALHARKSAGAIERSARLHKDVPIIVALTGTDLYGDLHTAPAVVESLQRATRIVALQGAAARELPAALRSRIRVIHQSVIAPTDHPPPREDIFEVCVIGNLRDVKDPFLCADAVRLLPAASRVHVVHLGAALTERMRRRAQVETSTNPRYEWIGPQPRTSAIRTLAACRLMVLTSKMEGGANVISESVACGVPVLSSRIPGSVGLLGAEYPGFFPVGDAAALATMLHRTETDGVFLRELTVRGTAIAPLLLPDREKQSWAELLREL